MKLKKGFLTHEVMGMQVMIASGPASEVFHGMVRNNRTAAFIVDCLKTDTSEEEITEAMAKKFDAPREVIKKDVHKIVEQLNAIGALE